MVRVRRKPQCGTSWSTERSGALHSPTREVACCVGEGYAQIEKLLKVISEVLFFIKFKVFLYGGQTQGIGLTSCVRRRCIKVDNEIVLFHKSVMMGKGIHLNDSFIGSFLHIVVKRADPP